MKTLPPGHLHPTTQLIYKATEILGQVGFEIVTGPELTTEKYNFDDLRIPADHPSRDTQDTFWTTDGKLLRTHTSAMQIPAMENRKLPVRIVIPGRVYRNEALDSTHEATIQQLEGFAIDENITMSNLVGTIDYFLKELLGHNIETKYYPHHFAFVEPGMEAMIKWKGKWLEILGCGMIHPEVLKNMGVDPQKYTGFAFGMGVDRLMMLQRNVDDIRWTNSGDLRFLKQF